MAIAISSRVLQFRAGPNEHRFHACEEHEDMLVSNDLFFAVNTDPVEPCDPDDEIECDWCREPSDGEA